MINTAVEDPERVARGLVRLAQSHRQRCADFLRATATGWDTPAVAKFAARISMFDRVIASASLALSNLPDDNNDRTPCFVRRLTAWPRTLRPIPCPSLIRSASKAPQSLRATGCSRRAYSVISRNAAAQIA